jgi:hypothetical protein
MILKCLCLFYIFNFFVISKSFSKYWRKLTNCWHFLLFLVCLPTVPSADASVSSAAASLLLLAFCCSRPSYCHRQPCCFSYFANVACEPAVDGIPAVADSVLASLLFLGSQLLQASLLMFASVMLLSLHLFCQYFSCYWLLRRRTCVAGVPAIAGIPRLLASSLLASLCYKFHCCFWHSCCCWHPFCRWVCAVFLHTLLLLLNGY